MNIIIRPLQIDDASVSYNWRNDKDVFKYTGNVYSNIITYEQERDWLENVILNSEDYRCAIVVDGVYVGNIYLTDIKENKADYHIFIGNKEYWGKGIAKKASELILHHAFQGLNLQYVNLEVNELNHNAYRLYLSLGFVEQARLGDKIQMRVFNCF